MDSDNNSANSNIMDQLNSKPNPLPANDPDSDPERTKRENEYLKIEKRRLQQEHYALGAVILTSFFLLFIFLCLTNVIKDTLNYSAYQPMASSARSGKEASKETTQTSTDSKGNAKSANKKDDEKKSPSGDLKGNAKSTDKKDEGKEAPLVESKDDQKNSSRVPWDWHFLVFCSALLLAPVFMLSRIATLVFNRNQAKFEQSAASDMPGNLAVEAVKAAIEQIASAFKK